MPLNKILIVTDALTEPLYNPRVRYIYNNLITKGIDVDWYAERYSKIPSYLNLNIKTIPFYKQKGFLGKLEWISKNILSLFFDFKNIYFSNKLLKAIKNENYDLVFCSTFHTFGLKAAYKAANKKNIPLHIDLRDIAEQCKYNEYNTHKNFLKIKVISNFYKYINIKRRNKIISKAQSISTVSPWHVNFLKKYNNNIYLIYNGYDKDIFLPQKISNKYFDIVYTGKWYGTDLQDPNLLFKTLKDIQNKDIRVIWYTNKEVHNKIKELQKQFAIKQNIVINNYVNNNYIPEILNKSSIILVLTNKGNHGIMTTKFFEALGVEKPILCVRSDEECLAKVIKETGCGIAATNVEEVKDFIMKYYNQWKVDGYTHIKVKHKELFTRQRQAQQFEELFNKLVK